MNQPLHHHRPVRFAVVGSGHIGKRHAEMIQRNSEARLVAMCDIRPYQELGLEAYPVPFFTSIEELLVSDLAPEIDVICVATPNGLHARHALLALEHRKHVIVEKPMALSKADCERIIFKALQMSRQVFCVMQNRYSPPAAWLKGVVDAGLLGEVFMVQINCYWNRNANYYRRSQWKGRQELDGGTLFTQFSHFVDIMYWLFGDITNIQARFANYAHEGLIEFEDSGLVTFDFVNGGTGVLSYSTATWDSNFESSITILGSKGTVKIGGQYMNEVVYCHVADYEMPALPPASPANDYGDYKGSAANHHFVFENVIATLYGHSTITTNALEGLKVVEIIERIYELKP
ncbi:MAG: Gfo/Idh/MocA family oxidoreductase [Bacteroidia bacterium]